MAPAHHLPSPPLCMRGSHGGLAQAVEPPPDALRPGPVELPPLEAEDPTGAAAEVRLLSCTSLTGAFRSLVPCPQERGIVKICRKNAK